MLLVSLIIVRAGLSEVIEPVIVLGGRVGHVFSLTCTVREDGKTGTEKEEGEGEELEQMVCFRPTGTLTLLSQLLLDKLVNGSVVAEGEGAAVWFRGRLGQEEEGEGEGTFVSFVTVAFGWYED